MISQGLIIREPWIEMILSGQKIWEMRSKRLRKRGPVALIKAGSGLVVGVANLIDGLDRQTLGDMASNFDRHRVPKDMYERADFNWFYPWVLADVRRLRTPIAYQHQGGVQFTTLDAHVTAEIISGLEGEGGRPRQEPRFLTIESRPSWRDMPFDQWIDARNSLEARRAAAQKQNPRSSSFATGGGPLVARSDIQSTLLMLDRAAAGERSFDWRPVARLVESLAALVTASSTIGFAIHLPLGMVSSSISALSALLWLLPLVPAALILGAFEGSRSR